jgi:purine nucleosidase
MAVLTLALPLESWRTGDPGLATLQYDTPLPPLPAPRRVWIDSDAACGHGARTDPDDCLAIALLARTPAIEVVGISTVFGNAPRDVVDQTVDALIATLTASGGRPLPVWRGAAAPQADRRTRTPAQAALVAALEAGPLAIVALGPLTNVAAVLRERPQLAARVTRLVAVMGRRPGHLFHPAEGERAGSLLGHGPVFRDFNFTLDADAARALVASRVELTLLPYDAARGIEIEPVDVAALAGTGALGRWLAARVQPWLAYWREQIGREGFYPFDLVAAFALVEPSLMRCARVKVWVGKDDGLPLAGLWPAALLVRGDGSPAAAPSARPGLYCARPTAGFEAALVRRLNAAAARGRARVNGVPRPPVDRVRRTPSPSAAVLRSPRHAPGRATAWMVSRASGPAARCRRRWRCRRAPCSLRRPRRAPRHGCVARALRTAARAARRCRRRGSCPPCWPRSPGHALRRASAVAETAPARRRRR